MSDRAANELLYDHPFVPCSDLMKDEFVCEICGRLRSEHREAK